MRNRLRNITSALAASAGLLLVLVPMAHADPILDFGMIAPTSGTISYATVGGPLKGMNIQVDNVTGLNTPLDPAPQPRTCFNCVLNFTTGNIITEINNGISKEWVFAKGGSITITGEVDLNGDGMQNDGGSVTLLSGKFNDNVIVLVTGTTMKVFGGGFTDQKNTNLLNLYGLPTGIAYLGSINLSFVASGSPHNNVTTDTFTSTSLGSGDILNSPVPEPGSLLLLGSGLIGFGYLAVRRRRGSA